MEEREGGREVRVVMEREGRGMGEEEVVRKRMERVGEGEGKEG